MSNETELQSAIPTKHEFPLRETCNYVLAVILVAGNIFVICITHLDRFGHFDRGIFWFDIVVGFVVAAYRFWCARKLTLKRLDRRRRAVDLCVKCGYDLRATPDCCPECGTVPAK
jgi:hypothetical protein